jgi:hypothetical protein
MDGQNLLDSRTKFFDNGLEDEKIPRSFCNDASDHDLPLQ